MELGMRLSLSSFSGDFFSSGLPEEILSHSQSWLNGPHAPPAHATRHSNPYKHILVPHAHRNKTHTHTHAHTNPPTATGWFLELRTQPLRAVVQGSLPDLQVIHVKVCLCTSFMYLLCHPAGSRLWAQHSGAVLTRRWDPAPDARPIHHTRKAVMLPRRNLLEYVCFQVKCCNRTINSEAGIIDCEAHDSVLVSVFLSLWETFCKAS